jgi:diguanylate cyclase (GGDEF)-like protein
MPQLLIVEDSKLFGSILKNEIEEELPIKVNWAKDYAEAEKLLAQTDVHYFLSLLDLNLPDAPNGEVVDLVLSKNIPVIVFTSDLNNEARESIWAKNVVDYILKEGTQSIDYIVSLTHRIHKNKDIKVLVVDDTKFYRAIISQLLTVHQYIVLEAGDGVEALKIIKKNPGIELVLTDYNMPNMDGFELTKQLRSKFRRDDMAIIGLSDQVDPILSAQFIKYGANDFINKPFLNEEFYCRVTQAVEGLEHLNRIKELSNKDFLTGLYNRRFFFEVGGNLMASSKRKQIKLAVALLDIDYFKKINDTYGHDAGDEVLRHLAQMLKTRFRDSDIVARIGGEEFCILLVNSDHVFVFDIFEKLRKSIEKTEVSVNGHNIKFTASFGVCTRLTDSLETMIKQADILLYQAKEEGRNRVKIDG